MTDRSAAAVLARMRNTVQRPHRSDAELLAAFQDRRDATAFEEIVRRHGPLVQSACRQVLPDAADADDAFQTTFVLLYRKAATVRRGHALAGWLFRVALRAAGEVKRSARRRRACEAEAADRRPTLMPPHDLSWRE